MEDRLRKFASLYELGSFTKAANELHISQPALSASIAKLERELKNTLLVRGVRPLKLTGAGEVAYQAAKDLAVHSDNLRLRLAELAQAPLDLKIGMIDSVADTLFRGGDALKILGNAKISVVVNNSRYLVDAVSRGDLDIAYVAGQPKPGSNMISAKQVGIEPLVIVAKSLKVDSFIGYDQASNTFSLVDEALKELGVNPNYSFYSTSPEVILRLALLGKGVAVLPYLVARQPLKTNDLIRSKPYIISRPIFAIARRDRSLPPALGRLTKRTTETLDELCAESKP